MSDLRESCVNSYVSKDGAEEYHLLGIDSWDEFETLVDFLVRRFSAEIVEALDGICSRTWNMSVQDLEFTMKHHDDIGNFFFTLSNSEEHQRLMRSIADAMNSEFYTKAD